MVNNVIGMTNEHELLKVIDFSNNRIQEISGKAFHKVSNVEKLILDHNDLSISGKTKTSGLCNIIFVILICFHFTNFLWYEKFSWLPSKNKVADEETEYCIDEKICEPQKVQIFISHIVFKRQPAGFFK